MGKFISRSNLIYIFLLMVATLIPFLITSDFIMHVIIMTLIWGVVALNWNLTIGFGGIFHIAQLTFMAIGGYSSAIFIINFGFSPWIGLLIGGLVAVLFSVIIGFPALKVHGIYLILLTFAFHYAAQQLILIFDNITRGTMGLIVPAHTLGDIHFRFDGMAPYYYLALLILVISIVIKIKIVNSNIGKALIASRDSSVLAKSSGINKAKYQIIVFALSAFTTGIIGAIYASYIGVIGPEIFSFSLIVDGLGMIVIGGIGTIFGPLIGSAFISTISEVFRGLNEWRPVLIGLTIILMLIFVPKGIVPKFNQLFNKG